MQSPAMYSYRLDFDTAPGISGGATTGSFRASPSSSGETCEVADFLINKPCDSLPRHVFVVWVGDLPMIYAVGT